ncbi:hypothetical protein ACQJ0O_12795 [Pseudomonas shirazensis]|uniref:hypothetical protein n=1 Tax=Pseudomonas shirazensis TaxID=2745494 RepID=UPI003CFC46A5
MTQRTFTVFLPDRPLPICIEADDFAVYGCELVLRKGDEAVARTSDRGFIVRTDLAQSSCDNAELLPWMPRRPRVEGIAAGAVTALKTSSAPVWPFVCGAAITLLCASVAWVALS